VASATIVVQTNLSIFVAVTAFLLILFLEPPFRLFTGWTTKSPDRRPALLALGLFVVFMVVILTPTLANYFGLLRGGGLERDVMLVAVPLWFLSLRTAWRAKLFERFYPETISSRWNSVTAARRAGKRVARSGLRDARSHPAEASRLPSEGHSLTRASPAGSAGRCC
jgi:hypothetical protein